MTTAHTARDVAVRATARSMETKTAPTTRTTAVPPPTRTSTMPGVSWRTERFGVVVAGSDAEAEVSGVIVVGSTTAGGVVRPVGCGMVGTFGRNMSGLPPRVT
jgi:hypothetical protein